MFKRSCLPELREAIDKFSAAAVDNEDITKEKEKKHSLKLLTDAVIQQSINSLFGYYSDTVQDDKELKIFRNSYKYKAPKMFLKAR